MAFAAALLPALAVGAATTVAGALLAPKPKAQVAQPIAQVRPRANSAVADALAARRGGRENQLTGSSGAEAGTGLKTKLGD